MKKILFTLVLFFSLNTYPQEMIIVNSEYIPHSDTILVFVPDSYKAENKYPVVYLLHGWSGNYNQWNEIKNMQILSDYYNFILVCPNGFYDSWYVNSTTEVNIKWETYFIDILIPHLFSLYTIDSANIFITGLSMGGHGALQIFFKYQNIFAAAGSTSGVLDITKFSNRWGIKKYLGIYEDNKYKWERNSVFQIANEVTKVKPFIFDCGTEDIVFEVNNSFYELCYTKKFPFTFISQPGKHHRDYWKESILLHFNFFSTIAKNKNNG